MDKEIHLSRERSLLERSADVASGYIVIAAIAALGLFCMACTLHLVKVERDYAIAARV